MSAVLVPHFEAYVPVLKVQELPKVLRQLKAPLRFYSAVVGAWIETPEGFVTDGCSIPHAPLIYLLAGGKAEEAGYTHDGLYTFQTYPREVCDKVLREAVIAMGYSKALADEMYEAVRLFGGSHWNLPNVTQPAHLQALLPTAPTVEALPRAFTQWQHPFLPA